MHEYRWHDAEKDKPESGISMLEQTFRGGAER